MKIPSIFIGKAVQKVAKLKGSDGSALPGLVVEKTNPNFIKNVLSKLPYGVVAVSGTNGKTTSTKIITELLEKQGLRVFTNKTGSNFVRGVISSILETISLSGKFDYDIAVLELDEAHAVKFSEVVPIDYALLINVQRDQLDRYGEIECVANYLETVAGRVRKTAVLNREDPRVNKFKAKNPVYFGLSEKMIGMFPQDDFLIDKNKGGLDAKITLSDLDGQHATYQCGNETYECDLTLKGTFNAYNAAGALTVCSEILKDAEISDLVKGLEGIGSAFGRGEVFKINGTEVEMLLVKNTSAFQLSLASFADDKHDYMICANDRIADGRDISWLWNVDFSQLTNVKIVSGIRATDVALRLKYDGIDYGRIIENLGEALTEFTSSGDKPKRMFVTYTAMKELRKIISGKSFA